MELLKISAKIRIEGISVNFVGGIDGVDWIDWIDWIEGIDEIDWIDLAKTKEGAKGKGIV